MFKGDYRHFVTQKREASISEASLRTDIERLTARCYYFKGTEKLSRQLSAGFPGISAVVLP